MAKSLRSIAPSASWYCAANVGPYGLTISRICRSALQSPGHPMKSSNQRRIARCCLTQSVRCERSLVSSGGTGGVGIITAMMRAEGISTAETPVDDAAAADPTHWRSNRLQV